MNQDDLAQKVGIHWVTLGKIERGRQKLTTEWMSRISAALGVSPTDLIGPPQRNGETISVVCYAETDNWRKVVFWPDEEIYLITIPPLPTHWRNFTKRASEIRDNTMNELYPLGSLVAWIPFDEALEPALAGRRYLIERIRGEQREVCVREYYVDARGGKWFVPRTTDISKKTSLEAHPKAGEKIKIIGRIIWASRVEED